MSKTDELEKLANEHYLICPWMAEDLIKNLQAKNAEIDRRKAISITARLRTTTKPVEFAKMDTRRRVRYHLSIDAINGLELLADRKGFGEDRMIEVLIAKGLKAAGID